MELEKCPICGAEGVRDGGMGTGVGALLDMTCVECDWHWTSDERRDEVIVHPVEGGGQ